MSVTGARINALVTAIHEAGHVVVAQTLGVRVHLVSRTERYALIETGDTAEIEAMIDLAGACAESRLLGHRIEPQGTDVPDGDSRWIEEQREKTERIIDHYWIDICDLAVQLLETQ